MKRLAIFLAGVFVSAGALAQNNQCESLLRTFVYFSSAETLCGFHGQPVSHMSGTMAAELGCQASIPEKKRNKIVFEELRKFRNMVKAEGEEQVCTDISNTYYQLQKEMLGE